MIRFTMRLARLFYWVVLFFIALLATILSVIFLPNSAVSFAKSFSDVAEDHEHYAAIEYLKAAQVIQGYPDGTFKPEQSVNRAEALKMIFMQAKVQPYMGNEPSTFKDVASNAWFYPFIMKAFQDKIVSGYQDGTFKPENQVTLAEALKMALLTDKIDVKTVTSQGIIFPDVTETDWYAPYARYARDYHIVLSQDDGNLKAVRPLTRGELAELLYRVDVVKKNPAIPFPLAAPWQFFVNEDAHFKLKVPFYWEIIKDKTRTIVWKKDSINNQLDYEYMTPLSAKVVIRNIPLQSDVVPSDYFAQVKVFSQAVFPNEMINFSEKKINNLSVLGVSVPSRMIEDWYFILPNQSVLIVYSRVGTGVKMGELRKMTFAMVGSLEYMEPVISSPDKEYFILKINENLLVEGKGKEVIQLIPDSYILETDPIGVGTGPVDYYYSATIDMTLKYERTGDVILAKSSGKTTRF